MVRIELTNGGYALIDEEDLELVNSRGPWYRCKEKNTWYAKTTRCPKIRMHTLILGKKKGKVIDHRDEDGLNNTRSNLQHIGSGRNKAKSSRCKGYRKWGRKWQVNMMVAGKKFCESYLTESEAQARVNELKLR